MVLPYLDLNTVSFYCSGSMPTPDRGRSSHLPLEFARHLSMYGHQGARQSHCKSTKRNIFLDKSRNLSPIFSLFIYFFFLQGRKTFYHRIITEFESRPKQVFLVKCDTSFKNEAVIVKRSARPQFPNFRGVE